MIQQRSVDIVNLRRAGFKVWIIAAPNCPKKVARRAEEMARQLSDKDIDFDLLSGVRFELTDENPVLYSRIEAVTNGDTPIVVVPRRILPARILAG